MLAGIVVGLVLTLGTDLLLHRMGVFPPSGQPVGDGPLALATAYRIVYSILRSYIAARLAIDRPMLHAMAGGVIGFVVSIAGAVVMWNRGAEFGSHWNPLALIATALPCSWVGGRLREKQLRGVMEYGRAWRESPTLSR